MFGALAGLGEDIISLLRLSCESTIKEHIWVWFISKLSYFIIDNKGTISLKLVKPFSLIGN